MFGALIFALAASAPPAQVALESRVAAAATRMFQSERIVGGAAGVVKDGKLISTTVFGVRNLRSGAPVDAQTRFEIGSVTKQFTAAAILQLQEHGKLRIDDTLATYLPAFPHANDVTLRELLNQVSGLPEYLDGPAIVKQLSKPGGLAQVAARAKKLDFAPGTRWEYSNTNYYVLGEVVARVSHQSYESYVRTHLFAPAGMTHSAFIDDEPHLSNVALSYWKGGSGAGPWRAAPPIPVSWAGGAGEIVSTLADLAAWNAALENGTIVSATDYRLMSSPGKLKNGHATDYGMGLGINPVDGHARIWHNGGTLGSFTMNAIYPDDRLNIIVFENSTMGDPQEVERAVFHAIFPETALAEHRAASGEDLAVRPEILRYLNQTLNGAMPKSEMSPAFAKLATPHMQKAIANMLASYGKPTAVIFKGKRAAPHANVYSYRVEFGTRAMNFSFVIDDKNAIVDGIEFDTGA